MRIVELSSDIWFPPVESASEIGILAVGGDLCVERLLYAYRHGIFPWYSDGEPIIWWSPDPRFVLFPDRLRVSRSMRQLLKKNKFTVTFDRAFRAVMRACATPRRHQPGTWITAEMLDAYCVLHERGYAHSVEVWESGTLVGGLYGVSLGRCFYGESMFSVASNASKVALVTLVQKLREQGFSLIDSQVYNEHMESMGACEIPRKEFLRILDGCLGYDTLQGNWGDMIGSKTEPETGG